MRYPQPPLHRRSFLSLVAGLGLGFMTRGEAAAPGAANARIGLVLPGDRSGPLQAQLSRGAELGAVEASRTAALRGGSLTLTVSAPARRSDSGAAAASLVSAGVCAIVGGFEADDVRALATAASGRALVFNVAAADDGLRHADCAPHVFHIAASNAMRVDAVRVAQTPAAARVVHWHPSLQRFGAAQVNDRYQQEFGEGMPDHAWCAWLALKILGEAVLRTRSTQPSALTAHLSAPRTRIDGHKGRPLSFRARDHQLRQPLYVEAGGVLTEVPRALASEDAEVALDQLGVSGQAGCDLRGRAAAGTAR
jgi:ABC-type branched-subunit amino acid transport system substrate-binding protein